MAIWEIMLFGTAFCIAVLALVKMMRRKHDHLVGELRNQLRVSKFQLMEQMQSTQQPQTGVAGANPEFQTKLDDQLHNELKRQLELENQKNPGEIGKAPKKAA